MLNEINIVQTALSAFNNAALYIPAFFWTGLLALPLFVIVFQIGAYINRRMGWNHENILKNVTVWNAGLTFLWVVLFGGNYFVLRDELSLLPMLNALIVFLTSLFVSSYVHKLPVWFRGWKKLVIPMIVIALVVMSDLHTWWGAVLQLSALVSGCVLGRVAQSEMRPIGGTVLIILTTVTAVLMQPEYFRFGQLGNLTLLHLIGVLFVGATAVMTVVLSNFVARGKIYNSAYIKLKWLGRVICLLGGALFLLTEAVPVFLGTLVAIFLLARLSVYHADNLKTVAMGNKMLALTLIGYGVLLIMPWVTVLGILYWVNNSYADFGCDIRRLL